MAGKGDKPRNNFSEEFRDNYDSIDWGHSNREKSKQAKKTQAWCEKCDSELVEESGKCSKCGERAFDSK